MRACYVSKTCIGHFTQSDAIYHVPLSLARKWDLVLLTGESASPRGVAQLLQLEVIVTPGSGWSRRACSALRKVHQNSPVDVILTGIDEASLLVGLFAQWRLGIPWIAVCEDHPFQSRYDQAALRGQLERLIRTWFLRFALRMPRRLIYFIHEDVLNFLWIKPSIKAPLHNAADLETIEPIRAELESRFATEGGPNNLVGYVGVVNEAKGGAAMLDVFRLVAQRHPNARLRLIGRVEKSFQPTLERLLDQHDLRSKVEITGQHAPEDALRLAGECAVCIHAYTPLPWLYWNHVLKVLEYMAVGVPVVSVDYPGTRAQIVHGQSGMLVPAGDHAAMAEAVVDLLNDPEKRAALRQGGLERARELSWKAAEEKLYEIVGRCAAHSGMRQ